MAPSCLEGLNGGGGAASAAALRAVCGRRMAWAATPATASAPRGAAAARLADAGCCAVVPLSAGTAFEPVDGCTKSCTVAVQVPAASAVARSGLRVFNMPDMAPVQKPDQASV